MNTQRHIFTVHQIHLTRAEIDAVNRDGHLAVPKQVARMDVSIPGGDPGAAAGQAWVAGHFEPVAKIVAVDNEDVFNIGNIGPEERIAREAEMHSISVGDIIEGPDGLHVVASFGFKPVLFK